MRPGWVSTKGDSSIYSVTLVKAHAMSWRITMGAMEPGEADRQAKTRGRAL